MHWIRHILRAWVERQFGYAVARAYAGHTDGSGELIWARRRPTSARTSPRWLPCLPR